MRNSTMEYKVNQAYEELKRCYLDKENVGQRLSVI